MHSRDWPNPKSQNSMDFFIPFFSFFSSLRLNQALTDEGYDITNNRYPEGYQEAPLAYDAVWSVALAFNKTMEQLKLKRKSKSLKDFTYTDREIADEIYAAMNSTQFLGVSVSWLIESDRFVCVCLWEFACVCVYEWWVWVDAWMTAEGFQSATDIVWSLDLCQECLLAFRRDANNMKYSLKMIFNT